MNNFDQAFAKLISKVESYFNEAPKIISTLATRHFRDSFKNSGFTDEALEPWTPRQKGYRPGSIPLVKTGKLRGSVRATVVNRQVVQIVADVPYAKYHQEGIGNNPKRRFIGDSALLNRTIKNQLNSLMRKIM